MITTTKLLNKSNPPQKKPTLRTPTTQLWTTKSQTQNTKLTLTTECPLWISSMNSRPWNSPRTPSKKETPTSTTDLRPMNPWALWTNIRQALSNQTDTNMITRIMQPLSQTKETVITTSLLSAKELKHNPHKMTIKGTLMTKIEPISMMKPNTEWATSTKRAKTLQETSDTNLNTSRWTETTDHTNSSTKRLVTTNLPLRSMRPMASKDNKNLITAKTTWDWAKTSKPNSPEPTQTKHNTFKPPRTLPTPLLTTITTTETVPLSNLPKSTKLSMIHRFWLTSKDSKDQTEM